MEQLLQLAGAAGGVAALVWLFVTGTRKKIGEVEGKAETTRANLISDLEKRVGLLESENKELKERVVALETTERVYLQLVSDHAKAGLQVAVVTKA